MNKILAYRPIKIPMKDDILVWTFQKVSKSRNLLIETMLKKIQSILMTNNELEYSQPKVNSIVKLWHFWAIRLQLQETTYRSQLFETLLKVENY